MLLPLQTTTIIDTYINGKYNGRNGADECTPCTPKEAANGQKDGETQVVIT